ncbi:MAG: bifunctional metallophosphatase/5'-nucleotidase [Sphingosinicella sp.]|nr:bifunctional metallophosphatase/5'-nucleotidase [Sphingosinicella sp.]
MRNVTIASLMFLSACVAPVASLPADAPVRVKIIAFNDFHGALQPPGQTIAAAAPDGTPVRVPAGGAAYLASAIARLKSINPNNVVVSAGDLISASPLASALFLDEPTILAMNAMGLDFNAVGNHEFDRGSAELLRMQYGGCARHSAEIPCRVDPNFPGARFRFLAANVTTASGNTLFPGYAIKSFGRGRDQVRIAFIGLTLKETDTLVTPKGVAGLTFRDEADSINALIPKVRAEGADAVVVLIHQGVSTKVPYSDASCEGMDGGLMPILARLDPAVDLIVSGHTHNAYVCDYGRIDPAKPFLVTSAGRNGTMLTDITLSIDPESGEVTGKNASSVIVQSEGFIDASGPVRPIDLFPIYSPDPAVASIVDRYAAAAAPIAARIVGRLEGPALREAGPSGESVLGNLIADAFLSATHAHASGGSQIAFTNSTSLRTDLIPSADGSVTFGQLFRAQPFANDLVVKTMTGRQIRAVLEQQFDSGSNSVERPIMLQASKGFIYSYDLRDPVGSRVRDLRIDGRPLADKALYRVTMNSFLASGGDNFTAFTGGADPLVGPRDIAALEAYIAAAGTLQLPSLGRVTRLSP